MEDKKCRICGHADMANQNFYNCHSKLVEKIVAVFPIVLYPNDPLPKHICKKCLVCATTMYSEIERALRNQNKWISNVRSVQPDNSYVKVVDSIEGAMKQTQKLVSKIAGEELGERAVCRMFNFKTEGGMHHRLKNNISVCLNKPAPIPIKTKPVEEFPVAANTNQSNRESSFHTVLHKPATKITQLTTVLELNGCTLTKVKPAIKPPKVIREAEEELKEPFETQPIDIQIKEEPLDHDEKYSEFSVKCKMCYYCCETVEELAIHQLNHLTLSVTKLSEKRYLDKRVRRGRLIRVAEKKCIRCLNCWRIFVDNKSILHHWSTGDCNFFCQICGKDFASSPKMLREHVLAAHGISYKSVKHLRPHTFAPKRHIKRETSPQKSELSPNKGVRGGTATSPGDYLSVKVACTICMKVFANFKARNSHMRAHKHPPFLPAQPPPSLADTLLAFNRSPLLAVKDEPTDYDDIPQHIVGSLDGPGPSTSKTVQSPPYGPNPALQSLTFPSPKLIQRRPKNVLCEAANPTGIRTKYVQIRPNPNAVVFKSEPGQVLKVKSLAHLQDPSISSQQPESADKAGLHVISTAVTPPNSNGLGVVTTPPKDNMNYGQIFNCHPCRGKFSSKLELFRHKRKCTANNLFPCQFCSRHFLTSADLQLHIMLLHHGGVAQ